MEKAGFIKKKAIALGASPEWCEKFNADTTDEEMVMMLKENMDFCVKNRFPSAKYLRDNFAKPTLNEHGIFANQTVHSISQSKKADGEYVFMGTTNANVSINKNKAATVYALDMCNLSVRVRDTCRVSVRLYHSAKVDIENMSIFSVYVYRKGRQMNEIIIVPPGKMRTVTA